MTVLFSKKCELALQAVLFLSAQPEGELFAAGEIAERLRVPKDFVSKVLQTLTSGGIVGSRKGKSGGFYLGKAPEEVRLIDIVSAIDGLEMFHNCVLGFPGCSTEKPCPVHEKWGSLRSEAFEMLGDETLAELRDRTREKIASIRK